MYRQPVVHGVYLFRPQGPKSRPFANEQTCTTRWFCCASQASWKHKSSLGPKNSPRRTTGQPVGQPHLGIRKNSGGEARAVRSHRLRLSIS